MLWLRLVLAAPVLTASAAAQFPSLELVLPRGAQRGTEVELTLHGKHLASARELVFEPGGLTVSGLEAQDTLLKAKVTIDGETTLGARAVWVRTAGGLTNLGTFHVGALKEITEAEPNGTREEAQAITLETTINGVANNEDVDLYAFEGKAGTRVSVEVEGQRLGARLFDPALAVFDPRGFSIGSCDDSALGRQDPALTVVLPEDGTYVVQVRESAYRGDDRCRYRLHVGTFPRPFAVMPMGGRLAEVLEVEMLSEDGHVERTQVTLAAARPHGGWVPQDVAAVHVETPAGIAPTPSWMRVGDLDNVLEAEPNWEWAKLESFEAPAALNGVLGSERDVDRFKFVGKKDETWIFAVHARSLRTPVDPVLSVFRANGQHLKSNDDQGGPDSLLEWQVPEDGEFVVQVRDHLMRGGPAFAYRIEMQRPSASITVGIDGDRPQVAIPQGGSTTINLNIERQRFGGSVDMILEGLPAGVTAQLPQVPQGINSVPIILSAAADAPATSALLPLSAKATDGDIHGGLYHPVELVEGGNNRIYWSHTIDRLPIAVTDPAPIAISVAPPGVPLPRGGRVPLIVNVERREGFEGNVTLRVPYMPPGVNTSRQLQVGKDATTGQFDLDAAGDARKGTWQLVIAADCEGPHGRVTVASALITLEVTDPLLTFVAEPVSVDQGQGGEMFVTVTRGPQFAGEATVEMVNLPHQVASEVRTVDASTESLVFPITTTGESPVGKHNALQFSARVQLPGGEVLQGLTAAELRVQQPAPAPVKVAEASAKKEEPRPEPKPEEKPAKPPTRLEKLRAEHAARLEGKGEQEGQD